MLKRLSAACFLLLLCFVLCASSSFALKKMSDEIMQSLEKTSLSIKNDNLEQAMEELNGCEEKWERYSVIFNVLLDHSETDILSLNINAVKPLIEKGAYESALEKIEESIGALDEIVNEQRLNVENIL